MNLGGVAAAAGRTGDAQASRIPGARTFTTEAQRRRGDGKEAALVLNKNNGRFSSFFSARLCASVVKIPVFRRGAGLRYNWALRLCDPPQPRSSHDQPPPGRPVSGHSRARDHLRLRRRAAADRPHRLPGGPEDRVACVGDSITWGDNIYDRWTDCYPTRLQEDARRPVRRLEPGHLGARCSRRATRASGSIKQVDDFQPQIIILKLGSNDSKPQNWK